MERRRIVIDTNVIVAALRSRQGASYRLLSIVDQGQFETALSVPLVLEYEDALYRPGVTMLAHSEIDDILDYMCAVGKPVEVHFRWRPCLKDPKDDMLLELAVAGRCESIVTFNKRDFEGAREFGISVVTPAEYLGILEKRI